MPPDTVARDLAVVGVRQLILQSLRRFLPDNPAEALPKNFPTACGTQLLAIGRFRAGFLSLRRSLRGQCLGQAYIQTMAAAIPLKRLGTVEEIGHAVAFLASEEAGFITGQTLVVDGGQTLPESRIV